ncbi:hypothetical protein EON83_18520 [bacterium]|nr:MAG: hypothetical protein EON83_18520 [bacterium]
MPPFFVRPWDRPRLRLHPPRADFTAQYNGKAYFGREVHGLTFFLEEGRSDEWMLAFNPDYTGDFEGEMKRGQMARYILLPYKAETWSREFPLFLRPDGTGWLRESWNREDIEFSHDLSLHEWLEAPASAIFPFASELFKREIAPQLEYLGWPKGRDLHLEYQNGTRAELSDIVSYILALESNVRGEIRIIRATFESESPFYRAGVFTVQAQQNEVELWFDEENGERLILPWKHDTLRLSKRFWTLCDLAVDQITPLGHYFDSNDKGAGRLSESPQPRVFSLQFISDKLPSEAEAHQWLKNWLAKIGADEAVLGEDAVETFEARNPDYNA